MEVRGGNYGGSYGALHCEACGVGLAPGEVCEIPGCPRYGTRRSGATLDGARALRQIQAQADDEWQRRDVAYAETRSKLAAGDVNNPSDALAWLAGHTAAGIRHE